MSRCFTINSARIRITLTVEHNLHYLERSEKHQPFGMFVDGWNIAFRWSFFNDRMGKFENLEARNQGMKVLDLQNLSSVFNYLTISVSKRKQKVHTSWKLPTFYVQIWLLNAWASIRPGVQRLPIKHGSVEKSCESKGNESWKDPFPLQRVGKTSWKSLRLRSKVFCSFSGVTKPPEAPSDAVWGRSWETHIAGWLWFYDSKINFTTFHIWEKNCGFPVIWHWRSISRP